MQIIGNFEGGTLEVLHRLDSAVVALALVILDEFNVIRSEISDLKARVAVLDGGDGSALPDRTIDQLKTAIKNQI